MTQPSFSSSSHVSFASFVDMFQAQVARTPASIALRSGDVALSYAALNAAANRVAHALIERGVVPDRCVGLCAPRGVELVIGLLGILKAGGAYVPLDPGYPRERVRRMLEDSAPMAVVSAGGAAEALGVEGARVLDVADTYARADDHDSVVALRPDHLAYVIYTSGSTGVPKGVAVEHRQLMHLWHGMEARVFGTLPAASRVALNASVSFDASLQALTQLCSGHTLCVVPASVRSDAEAMLAYLATDAVAVFDCTPTQLELLIQGGLFDRPWPALRTILVGGEPFPASAWKRAAAASITCYNAYGPTECTVNSTLASVTSEHGPHLGEPLPGVLAYVVDTDGSLAAPGVVGELWLGGAGVARGYLHRPELTAERFLADPFGGRPGRVYRTGDLVRRRMDGTLEYLGRNDDQVKIRGHRIELGEIAAVLDTHPSVRKSLALPRRLDENDVRLVAYVVPADDTPAPNALRDFLAGRLPEYMVPYAYVTVATFPTDATGKIDRGALPRPTSADLPGEPFSPPQGDTETAIALLWSQLLRVERVGRNDNFFALGGHSLHAMQLIERMRRIGLGADMQNLFNQDTLGGFAATARWLDDGDSIERDHRTPGMGWIETVTTQKQRCDWVYNQITLAQQRPSFCIQHRVDIPRVEPDILRQAFDAAIARHDALRTTIHLVNDVLVQRIRAAYTLDTITPVDLSSEPDAEAAVGDLINRLRTRTFDFSELPLFTVTVIRTGTYDAVVFIVDHVCMDQAFLGRFVDEVMQEYVARREGRASGIPRPMTTYRQYAEWERTEMTGESGRRHVAYWADLIRRIGVHRYTDRFADYDAPWTASHRGYIARCVSHLPSDITPHLARHAHEYVSNLFHEYVPMARFSRYVNSTVLLGLAERATRAKVPLSALAIAAANVLLQRLTGLKGTLVSVLTETRPLGSWQDSGGSFVNDALYAVEYEDRTTLNDAITQVVEQMPHANEHKVCLLPAVLHSTDVSLEALGTFCLNYISAESDKHLEPFAPRHRYGGFASMEFNLTVVQYKDGLYVDCEYRKARFSPETIENVVTGGFITVLEAFADSANPRVADILLVHEPSSAAPASASN